MEVLKLITVGIIAGLAVYGAIQILIDIRERSKKLRKPEPWVIPVHQMPDGYYKDENGKVIKIVGGVEKAVKYLDELKEGLRVEPNYTQEKRLMDQLIEEKRLANQKKKVELAEAVVLATANIVKAFSDVKSVKPEPSVLPWKIKMCNTCPGEWQEVCLRFEVAEAGLFTYASVSHNVESDAVNFYKAMAEDCSQHKYEIRQIDKDSEGVTVVVRMSRIKEGSEAERYARSKKPETTNLTYRV